jgi:subtilisin family serine protease
VPANRRRAPRLVGLLTALAVLVLGTGRAGAAPGEGNADALMEKARRDGTVRVIVGLRDDAGEAAEALSGTRHRTVRAYDQIPYAAMELSPAALQRLRASGEAFSIVEDRRVRLALSNSVPLVEGTQAWANGVDGTGQVVAVVDTGVDKAHPFLAGKVVAEACFSYTSSCPNGQVSQVGPGAGVPCTFAVSCDHGTHVAGIAAGSGSSFSGVARGASVISVRVFSNDGGLTAASSDILAGLQWLYSQRHTFPIAAVNMSLGGSTFPGACDSADPAMAGAIDALRAAGIATVVSSGNDGLVSGIAYPACMSGAVSVGSTTLSDGVSTFSNTAAGLSLLAPGSGIVASVTGGGYAAKSGTSMAAPHAAGTWALLRQRAPGLPVQGALDALRTTAIWIVDGGNGLAFPRIRVMAALHQVPALPGAPSGVQASAGDRSATVSWTAPVLVGGGVSAYVVSASPGGHTATAGGGSTSTTVGGLANGTTYTFTVRATNAAGTGPASAASNAVTPTGPPPAPAPTPAPQPARAPVVWAARADGGVVAYGAPLHGSMAGRALAHPVVGLAARPAGDGYWLLGRDGGIFSFGRAAFFGSTGAIRLNQPVVGMAATRSGQGYWLVATDGGIFAFGDAAFFGSTGDVRLNQPIVGMAATPSGRGYWLVARDGGIFAFGDAGFFGSTGDVRLNQPIVGMAATPSGRGYWLVARDGGIFAFGDATFLGSRGAEGGPAVAGMAAAPGGGYYLVDEHGAARGFGTPTPPASATTGGGLVVAVASA